MSSGFWWLLGGLGGEGVDDMELDTRARMVAAFYRLTGSLSGDDALVENGEADDEVAYLYLTRGIRAAQAFLMKEGMTYRWQKRSSTAVSWSGTESSDGGRYISLPSDFWRLPGTKTSQGLRTGALVEANGTPWGVEVGVEDQMLTGGAYYLKRERLWITKGATPPSTLYLEYVYKHPAITEDTTEFDFPAQALPLAVAEAACAAKEESWLPGGPEMESKIERALARCQAEAVEVAHQSRDRGRIRAPQKRGTRW